MASGHGVSEAVRLHITTWVDKDLVDKVFTEYNAAGGKLTKEQLQTAMKSAEDWKRKARRKTDSGYEREYYSQELGEKSSIRLLVHSPASDFSADSYVFTVSSKPIAGGKTKLQSAFYSSKVKDIVKTESFSKFTTEELRKIATQMEYGDGFSSLEFERVV